MSFSSRAKEEMTVKLPKQKCCEKARIFGILLFSGGFTKSGISVTTEIPEAIELLRRFFSETFGDEGKTETVASKSGKALTANFEISLRGFSAAASLRRKRWSGAKNACYIFRACKRFPTCSECAARQPAISMYSMLRLFTSRQRRQTARQTLRWQTSKKPRSPRANI